MSVDDKKEPFLKRVQQVRVDLQSLKLRKTGHNKYSNYTYYELSDFLPAINELCLKYDIFTLFSLDKTEESETAILEIIDVYDVKRVATFTSPTAEVNIGKKKDGTGGAEKIQNLGGKITYMRRYMLMTAFEIIESDTVEHVQNLVKQQSMGADVTAEDMKKINGAKSVEELTKIFGSLKDVYKMNVLTPLFKECKEKFNKSTLIYGGERLPDDVVEAFIANVEFDSANKEKVENENS